MKGPEKPSFHDLVIQMQYYTKKIVNTINLFRVHDREMFLNSHSLVKMQSSITRRFFSETESTWQLSLVVHEIRVLSHSLLHYFSILIYFLFCLFLLLSLLSSLVIGNSSLFFILSPHNVFAFPSSFDFCVIFPQLLFIYMRWCISALTTVNTNPSMSSYGNLG